MPEQPETPHEQRAARIDIRVGDIACINRDEGKR